MNPDRMLNEDVMNEQSSLKLLWEVLYFNYAYQSSFVLVDSGFSKESSN